MSSPPTTTAHSDHHRRRRSSTPLQNDQDTASSSNSGEAFAAADNSVFMGERVRGRGFSDMSDAETFRARKRNVDTAAFDDHQQQQKDAVSRRRLRPIETDSSDDDDDDSGDEIDFMTGGGGGVAAKNNNHNDDVRVVRRMAARKEVGLARGTTAPEIRASKATAEQRHRQRDESTKSILKHAAARRIPFYNDRADRASIPVAERDVIIDEAAFEALMTDPATEFQRAYKPPSAAPVPPHTLAEVREHEVLDVLSELKLRDEDWFSMIVLVAGMLQVGVSTLIEFTPSSLHSAPASVASITGRFNGVGGPPLSELSSNAADRALARLVGMIPSATYAPPPGTIPPLAGFDLGRPPPPTDDASLPTSNKRPPAAAVPTTPPLRAQSLEDIDMRFVTAAENVARETGMFSLSGARSNTFNSGHTTHSSMIHTGARFQNIRRQMEARAPPLPSYATSIAGDNDAELLRQGDRALAATSRQWVGRSTTTGVYAPKPAYIAARDSAYADLVSRAPQLRGAELQLFIRRGSSTSPQYLVRTMFARLIAAEYNVVTFSSNRNSKRVSDNDVYVAAAENCLCFFADHVSFSRSSSSFSVSQNPLCSSGVVRLPPGRTPYMYYDPHSPLRDKYWIPPECNPLMYLPSTINNPRRFNVSFV